MTITYNKKEAEKELSIKEMQTKTIVAHNEKKIKNICIAGGGFCFLIFLIFFIFCVLPIFPLKIGLFDKFVGIGLSVLSGLLLSVFLSLPLLMFIENRVDKIDDQNNEIKTLSLNAEYHKCHENKELICSEIVLNSLKLNFMDKSGKVYKESINIKDFETVIADGITETEVNLYEKKIYKPNPKFVSFNTGTPQNCSRQIHKNKRKINLKMLRGN